MIPPCDPAVLKNNSQFKRLHQHLTNNLLNTDGTTRADDNDPTREAVAEELRACQLRYTKKQLLKQVMRQIALDSRSSLPSELRDNVALIALFLESLPLDEFDNENTQNGQPMSLLDLDFNNFYSIVHQLVPHLSDMLFSNVNHLRAIADAMNSSPASLSADAPLANQSRSRTRARVSLASRPRLSSQLSDRQRRLRTLQLSELPASRTQMAVTAAEVLAARAEIMERTVVLLERTKHGALSRAAKAQAEHLATVAEGMQGKVSVMNLESFATVYTPDTLSALENYHEHLQDTRMWLEEQRKVAMQVLGEYETVGIDQESAVDTNKGDKATQGGMADIARRYGALAKEVESIKMEIKRLGV